jgi:hypothetical protein
MIGRSDYECLDRVARREGKQDEKSEARRMICSGRIMGAEIRAHAPQKLSACFSKGEPVCTAVRQRGNVVNPSAIV